ncbi:UNVERIFIED_CONTAM: hypothetical protein K2H54_027805 [Gekko kuhli]
MEQKRAAEMLHDGTTRWLPRGAKCTDRMGKPAAPLCALERRLLGLASVGKVSTLDGRLFPQSELEHILEKGTDMATAIRAARLPGLRKATEKSARWGMWRNPVRGMELSQVPVSRHP